MSLETIDFKYLPLRDSDRLLDLGCGEGRHTISACLQGVGQAIGLDLSLSDLKVAQSRTSEFGLLNSGTTAGTKAKQNAEFESYTRSTSAGKSISFTVGSGLNLPFSDASFDRVICSEVLEHIPDYETVLGEIHRVLKPGGILAVSVPRFLPEWMCWQLSTPYHQVEGGHIRIFRSGELRRSIEALNMNRYARHWAHALHVPYWWLRCLFWSTADESKLVKLYHRFLVWDLMQKPRLTYWLDRFLNPIMGKSIVMYFQRGSL